MEHQHASHTVVTDDGSITLRHPEHGECYHSKAGAAFEANALYLGGSGFAELVQARGPEALVVSVLDVGLGLGYNACSTIAAWWQQPAPASLDLVSLEHNVELFTQLRSTTAPWQATWPELWGSWLRQLRSEGTHHYRAEVLHPSGKSRVCWDVYLGPAEQRIRDIAAKNRWCFVWQDPFSPRLNPELWSSEWFAQIRAGSRPEVCLLTYSVSRLVRDNLQASGWLIEKIPSCGPKRQWLRARLP